MRPLAPALAATLLALPAVAQQSDRLPDVTTTATRMPLAVAQTPAGVTVIDRDEIERRGYVSLVDALNAVPGMRVVQQGGPGGFASVFMRGTNSNHVLVLRDGMPINDASTTGGLYNFGIEMLADVERIEVVRGPMSGIYGSGAIGGVINLISRRGQGAPSLSAEGTVGVPRSVHGIGHAGGEAGPVDFSFTVESASTRGDNVIPRRVETNRGERDGFRGTIGTVNLGYTPVEGTRLSAFLRSRTTTYGYDNIGYPAFDDPNQTGNDDNLTWRLGGETLLFGAWRTALFVGQSRDDRRYTNLLDPDDPNFAFEDSSYEGRRTDVQWNNTVSLPDIGAAQGIAATFGYEHIRDSANVKLRDSGFAQDVDQSATADAGHVGLQGTFFERLTLTGHLRYEDTQDAGDATTWRAGAVLAVPEINSRLHAAYGTGFRAPTLFDRYGVGSFGFRGNPDLKPEKSESWEIGIAIDITRGVTMAVTYFDTRIRDMIQYNANFTSLENVGRAKIHGIESTLTVAVVHWLDAQLGYTWTDARDGSTDEKLLRRPEHQISAKLDIRPLPQLLIAPEVLFLSRFRDSIVDDAGFPAGTGSSRSGTIVNIAASYELTPSVTLLARGKNLTDSDFEPASGFALPGPTFTAGARMRF